MGFKEDILRIDVPIIPDDELKQFAFEHQAKIRKAMQFDTLPPKCGDQYIWEGRFCESYCEVRDVCPDGGKPKDEPGKKVISQGYLV